MKLTLIERAILRNQLLSIAETDEYVRSFNAHLIEILEGGFEGEYELVFARLQPPLSEEDCTFVKEVLQMFEQIGEALADGMEVSTEERQLLTFTGFSSKHESRFMKYAEFISNSRDQSAGLRKHISAESQDRMAERYRRMYTVWVKGENPWKIGSLIDLKAIAAAAQ